MQPIAFSDVQIVFQSTVFCLTRMPYYFWSPIQIWKRYSLGKRLKFNSSHWVIYAMEPQFRSNCSLHIFQTFMQLNIFLRVHNSALLQFPFKKIGLFMPQKGVPYFLFDIDLGGKITKWWGEKIVEKWNLMKSDETWWNLMKPWFHQISSDFIRFHQVSFFLRFFFLQYIFFKPRSHLQKL